MKILKGILASLSFRSEEKQVVEVFVAWEVRWVSRHGSYSTDTRKELRVFPLEEDAKAFKKALEDAFKLIKHTSHSTVYLEKQEFYR